MKILSNEFTDESYKKYFNKWSFDLSTFQKWAIKGIVDEKNILITAHTGSGKTLPAEFAIDYFPKKNKKVIYTTPIKALSNEKFNDLQHKFPDLSFGILTGDIKYNPEADVIIMTTEILYNTLFQKKMIEENVINKEQISLHFDIDIETELGCVVFDEIHYINDKNRGRIWEETIMLIPNNIQIIGLSATIDKPEKFCQWIETVKCRETWLCPHNKRIVPLTHYSFITYPDSYYKKFPLEIKNLIDDNHFSNKPIVLKEQNKLFREKNYTKILKLMKYFDNNNVRVNQFFVMNKVVEYLNNNNMLPALCFVFSRKKTKEFAEKITVPLFPQDSTIPSTIKKECKQILMKLPNYREYLLLPEYDWITKLLEKGIAVHHSGITPVFREMIEILFGKGYIKLLFATETFAVGINMPTKTVIFSSLTKYDGKSFRFLKSHEYTQMAGRAGRRGLDDKGYVIHLDNIYRDKASTTEMSFIFEGNPETLSSKFKINFNMLLKLLAAKKTKFKEFVEKSMVYEDIQKQKNIAQDEYETLKCKIQNFCYTFQFNFRTKKDDLVKYCEMKNIVNGLSSKKRKKMKQEMRIMETDTKYFLDDVKKYEIYLKDVDDVKNLERKINNIENYITNEVNVHLEILRKEGFVEEYELTDKGKMATNINEIHSLAISDTLVEKTLHNLTVEKLVAVLSIFCDIRLSDENKIFNEKYAIDDEEIVLAIKKVKEKYNKYYDIETNNKTAFMFNYELQYDLVDLVYKWTKAENENESLLILEELKKWDIHIGNFSKAILKICNIAMELENICLLQNDLTLLKKLKEIPFKLKKFVITNQSLYL
jgi:superfamily II RNA helicase